MNTITLAKLLMQRLNMGYPELANKCGLKRQTVYENIQRVDSGKRQRGIFPLMLAKLAFENGLEAEAFSILFGKEDQDISTVLRAAILYPDLNPEELSKLRKVEQVTSTSPLSVEVIKSVIEVHRHPCEP